MQTHDEEFIFVSDGVEFGRFPKRLFKLCKNPDTATVKELRQLMQLAQAEPDTETQDVELTAH